METTNNIVEDIRDLAVEMGNYLEEENLEKSLELEKIIQDKLVTMDFILKNDPLMDELKRAEGVELFNRFRDFLVFTRKVVESWNY